MPCARHCIQICCYWSEHNLAFEFSRKLSFNCKKRWKLDECAKNIYVKNKGLPSNVKVHLQNSIKQNLFGFWLRKFDLLCWMPVRHSLLVAEPFQFNSIWNAKFLIVLTWFLFSLSLAFVGNKTNQINKYSFLFVLLALLRITKHRFGTDSYVIQNSHAEKYVKWTVLDAALRMR